MKRWTSSSSKTEKQISIYKPRDRNLYMEINLHCQVIDIDNEIPIRSISSTMYIDFEQLRDCSKTPVGVLVWKTRNLREEGTLIM
jgi:hypothetical protein